MLSKVSSLLLLKISAGLATTLSLKEGHQIQQPQKEFFSSKSLAECFLKLDYPNEDVIQVEEREELFS